MDFTIKIFQLTGPVFVVEFGYSCEYLSLKTVEQFFVQNMIQA